DHPCEGIGLGGHDAGGRVRFYALIWPPVRVAPHWLGHNRRASRSFAPIRMGGDRLMGLVLIAAAIAALVPPAAGARAPLPDASPALWVVADADTKIYLFGTFHALDGKTDWFNDEVEAAFDDSDELVLETLVPKLPILKPAASARPVGPMAPVAGSASFLSST